MWGYLAPTGEYRRAASYQAQAHRPGWCCKTAFAAAQSAWAAECSSGGTAACARESPSGEGACGHGQANRSCRYRQFRKGEVSNVYGLPESPGPAACSSQTCPVTLKTKQHTTVSQYGKDCTQGGTQVAYAAHGSPANNTGSSPWGSIERLQALSNLLCIAGGEPSLTSDLQPAMREWLHVAASGATHGDELQRCHMLGAFSFAPL